MDSATATVTMKIVSYEDCKNYVNLKINCSTNYTSPLQYKPSSLYDDNGDYTFSITFSKTSVNLGTRTITLDTNFWASPIKLVYSKDTVVYYRSTYKEAQFTCTSNLGLINYNITGLIYGMGLTGHFTRTYCADSYNLTTFNGISFNDFLRLKNNTIKNLPLSKIQPVVTIHKNHFLLDGRTVKNSDECNILTNSLIIQHGFNSGYTKRLHLR